MFVPIDGRVFRYEVSTAGIKLIPSYVDKVINWPQPTTGRDLAAFLGFTNYYRKLLADFAKRTAGLNAVKSKKSIEWTEELVNDFNAVKICLPKLPAKPLLIFLLTPNHLF